MQPDPWINEPWWNYRADILADSLNVRGIRITTFRFRYPRFIHSELMTHRAFSRNAASSRAIPVKRMLAKIWDRPAEPIEWFADTPGMDSKVRLGREQKQAAIHLWATACINALNTAQRMANLGVHKSIVNRIVEPFTWMETIVTSTDWLNFYALRDHSSAQPEFQYLAHLAWETHTKSHPASLKKGQWHLPYGQFESSDEYSLEQKLKIATARCARISFLTPDGVMDHQKDIALHDRLVSDGHWSPFEHCAMSMSNTKPYGNFYGWFPYRKFFRTEVVREFRGYVERRPDTTIPSGRHTPNIALLPRPDRA